MKNLQIKVANLNKIHSMCFAGKLFTFSLGNKQIVHVTKPDMVKEITRVASLDFGRPSYHRKELAPLFGGGILPSNGPIWQYQKKILAPELHMDKVKVRNSPRDGEFSWCFG